MKLGYWDIRGLGQPIRYLLAYREVDFEEKRYSCGPPPKFDSSQWLDEKFTLDCDFPNLPYLLDGDDVKLTQNLAILRYLGRKYDLDAAADCDLQKRRVDLMEQQVTDFRSGWVRLCYSPGFASERDGYEKNLPNTLKAFSKFLGDRPYFAGDRLTYVDFIAYEMFAQHLVFSRASFADLANLTEFVARIEALPTMKAYLESDKHIKWPFNGDMASYGGRLSECPF